MKKKKESVRRPKTAKQIGVFKYDLFPYMLVHDIFSWDEDGDIKVIASYGYTMKAENLIAVFPIKKKKEIEDILDTIKRDYRIAQEDASNKLLHQLTQKVPALKKECEKHYAR